jgi:hypothetical protein
MQHPLEFVAAQYRKPVFFTFLFLTLILFAIFRVLDQPLRTEAAPNGIVSFEMAGDPITAKSITDSWKQLSLLLSSVAGQPNPDVVNTPYVFAAFGLGIDYLFMPLYAFTFAFGTLLATQKRQGWLKSMGALAGYGVFVASLFDAAENYSLLQILLGEYQSNHPAIAAFCASIKFGLLIFGFLVLLTGFFPTSKTTLNRS